MQPILRLLRLRRLNVWRRSVRRWPVLAAMAGTLFVASAGTTRATDLDVDVAAVLIPMSILVGDTTGNGAVTASDIGQTKSFSGVNASATSFRTDINASGITDATDISFVKNRSGTVLPPSGNYPADSARVR